LLCALGLIAFAGCSDSHDPVGPGPQPPRYKNLTEKWHVLFNMQLACNTKDIVHYKELLDPNDFVFFFAPGDVGGNIPPSWGYTEEVAAATNMFNKGGGVNNNPILRIDLELVDFMDAVWVEFDPVGQPGVYQVVVNYKFSIDTENALVYISTSNSRAQFRVRKDGGGKWRLVQWNDIDGRGALLSGSGVQPLTWGKLKELY